MSIQDNLSFRRHIPAEEYGAFTQRFPLFSELSLSEKFEFSDDPSGFQQSHPDALLFPDPFFHDQRTWEKPKLGALKIVVGEGYAKEAGKLADQIFARWERKVAILPHDGAPPSLASSAPLLLLGGAESNHWSLEIAKKYQVGIFSSEFPGSDGWGITSHWELEPGAEPCFIATFDEKSADQAIEHFLNFAVHSVPEATLQWVHHVHLGDSAPPQFRDFEQWLASWGAENTLIMSCFPGMVEWFNGKREKSYREIFCEGYLEMERDHPEAVKGSALGLPNTEAPFVFGLDCLRYYQMTGAKEALSIFREMLAGYEMYLRSPCPGLYIGGLDFKVGVLCNLWNWIEHHPDISPQERENSVKLILALVRQVRDYFRSSWKKRSVFSDGYLIPQNHETFKAAALACAWRYFRRWEFPDLASWKEEANAIFSRINPSASKHRENAGIYETFVPEHLLVWHEVMDRPIGDDLQEALADFALREWVTRDNFFFPVDYGDCDPRLSISRPFEVSPWLSGSSSKQKEVMELEASCYGKFPWMVVPRYRYFTGLQRSRKNEAFASKRGWSTVLLDEFFARQHDVTGTRSETFDKLCWRSGWEMNSQYLVLEGVGNVTLSHAHNEANGILRMNLAGRIWLFTNGYGRRAGIVDSAKSFRLRNRGPEDLNMLVVRAEGTGEPARPPFNATLKDHSEYPFPCSVTELTDYYGLDWRRYILLLPEAGMIVLDRVRRHKGTEGPLPPFELQWNVMGERSALGEDFLFQQDGVSLQMSLCGTSVPRWQESPIDVWRGLVEKGSYPQTRAIPSQGIFSPPSSASKDGHCFVTGFWLQGTMNHVDWDSEKLKLTFEYNDADTGLSEVADKSWGRIERNGAQTTVSLAAW